MPGKEFTDYCRKLSRDFKASLNKLKAEPRKEDIHTLRVSLKKLRTLWAFVELASNGGWEQTKHRKSTKKLFKLAGKVREDQLNQELIKEIAKSNVYNKSLSKSEQSHTLQLKSYLAAYDFDSLEKLNSELLHTIESTPSEDLSRAIEEQLSAEMERAFFYIKNLPEEARLHKIRIHLKNIQYLIRFGEKNNQILMPESFEKWLEKITDSLGNWHDYESLLHWVKAYELDSSEDSEAAGLKKKIEKLEKERSKSTIDELSGHHAFFSRDTRVN
jgi:CHAD domain-containing protein